MVVIAEVRSAGSKAVAKRPADGHLLFLRILCLIGLGLLPGMHAQAQMCSDSMKCAPGYRCTKLIQGAITGSCTKVATAPVEPKEKELIPCDTLLSSEACMKLDHCIWPRRTNACVIKCAMRKSREECQKPGLCLWIAQTGSCLPPERYK